MDPAAKVDYRLGVASDAPAAAAVHCEAALVAYAEIFPANGPKPTPASLTPAWRDLLRDETVLVAAAGNALIGTVALVHSAGVPSGLLLARLHVEPGWWGNGIGSRLHDQALEIAADQHARRINLWVLQANTRARRMYEHRGWRYLPGPTLPNDPPTIVDVLYERRLAA